jgi:hypothetical protein
MMNNNWPASLMRSSKCIVKSTRSIAIWMRYDALWREQQAQCVSGQTFRAAIILARPRSAELFMDYVTRVTEAGLERFRDLDQPPEDLNSSTPLDL